MSLSFAGPVDQAWKVPSIWSKCKNCRRRDAALPKNGRTFHGKCVENGDQMLINQHQLWDFARNSEIFGSEVHPGYCGGPWQLAGYPFKFRAFWPPHGFVVFTSKVKRLNILWQQLVPHDLYYLYCKADFHTIEGLVLFWHESVMSIAYFQIAEESSNCRNEKDYFPGFFNYPLLSQCNFTSVLLLSRLCRNWDKWSECCSWRTLL